VTCDMRASNSLIGGVTGGGKGRHTGRQLAALVSLSPCPEFMVLSSKKCKRMTPTGRPSLPLSTYLSSHENLSKVQPPQLGRFCFNINTDYTKNTVACSRSPSLMRAPTSVTAYAALRQCTATLRQSTDASTDGVRDY
jgi:hypothetical protein